MQLSKTRYIQLIHIGKNQLLMSDFVYRALLSSLTGKDSCKDMNISELEKVFLNMKSLGFTPISNRNANKKLSPKTRDKSQKTQLDKLRQLWIAMAREGHLRDGSEQALLSWSKGQAKRFNKNISVERLEWLTPGMLHRLIEQLKQWHKRCESEVKTDVQ